VSSSIPDLDELIELAPRLLERTHNGILVTDPSGRIRLVNPALEQILPLVPNPVGRTVYEAIPVAAIVDIIEQKTQGDQETTVRLGRRDLVVRVTSLGNNNGLLTIVHDVTRIRQAERYRREFVANVSHELRTPATAIAGYAETLLADRDRLPPDVVRMVEVILRNGRRLTELFDDLLHLAKLDAMDEPPPLQPTALANVVAESIDKLAALAESRQVTIQVQVPEHLLALANRDALGHVIVNLVSNAIKYSHEGGSVQVRARPDDSAVLFEVIDEGIGIDPAHHDRIFQRFYRVDKGRARAQGGTGLGLAIVKHLSKAMKAKVEVRSKKGRGATFRLRLLEAPPNAEE
jgi:two-component system phosphate regulon sensor histidine kinase PhoR